MKARLLSLMLLYFSVGCLNGHVNAVSLCNGNYHIALSTNNGIAISTDNGHSFNMRTTVNSGIISDTPVYVVAQNNNMYAAFNNYISVSNDGGNSFVNYSNGTNGLGGGPFDDSNYGGWIRSDGAVFLGDDAGYDVSFNNGATFSNNSLIPGESAAFSGLNSSLFVASPFGVYISTDNGVTFPTLLTTGNGLPGNSITSITVSDSNVYVATTLGLGISYGGGNSYVSKTTANGLGSNSVGQIAAGKGAVFISTNAGLAVSYDGGNSFTNQTIANGLPSNNVYGVSYAEDGCLYVITDEGFAYSNNYGQSFKGVNTSAYFPAIGLESLTIY